METVFGRPRGNPPQGEDFKAEKNVLLRIDSLFKAFLSVWRLTSRSVIGGDNDRRRTRTPS